MTVFGAPRIHPPTRRLVLPGLAVALMSFGLARPPLMAQNDSGLLIERQPFDRVILNAENHNTEIDVVLLELPERRVPDPLPQTGELELRRLNHPSVRYMVDWSSIGQVKLYERLVLEEAVALTSAGKTLEAFQTLQFLHKNYADMPGLDEASEQYVKRDALDAFAAKKYDESLAILVSLYDINPRHRGLAEAVQAVSDRVINAHLAARDFTAARRVLDFLKKGFLRLKLQNIAGWESKFEQGAAQQLQLAQRAIAEGKYERARLAVRRAENILPQVAGALELLREIDRLSPEIIVGVCQLAPLDGSPAGLLWAAARATRLTDPPLVEMVGFGGEGGQYQSRWISLDSDDSGLQLDLTLTADSLRLGFSPEQIALKLLERANPAQSQFQDDFAAVFQNLTISDGRQVNIHWQRPHVRPEALLRLSVSELIAPNRGHKPPGDDQAVYEPRRKKQMKFVRGESSEDSNALVAIVERAFENEEQGLAALQEGKVSVLDRVSPWLVEPLQAYPRIGIGSYRLPTIHVLQLNYAKPLLGSREFRRALCYGINRERIVRDLLLAGGEHPGFRVLSGPLPAGSSITDPVGYGYNQQLAARPYEPRLASVLATVARNSLAKRRSAKSGSEDRAESEETPPLLLVYPPNSAARTCCQTIQQQLTDIGIPVEIEALSADSSTLPPDYDLLYAELAIREPLVDARRLLGPRGTAGKCSSSMSLALEQVDKARNWRQARNRLREVHQVAHFDLPVIPLWQTIDSFAYRKALHGIGTELVTLYQNVADWRITYGGGTR